MLTACAPPGSPLGGAAWDGTHVWVGSFRDTWLRRIDPATCAVVATLPAPGRYVGGLAWDGTALWVHPEQSGQIYRVDPADGAVLAVIPSPSSVFIDPNGSGLAWDGSALWHADYTRDLIYRLDPADGTVLATIPAPGTMPTDLAWFAGQLLVADRDAARIFVVDPTDGTVLESCFPPGNLPWGLAVDSAGDTWNTDFRGPLYLMDTELDSVGGPFFENYCTSTVNSTGKAAVMSASGSASVEARDLVLEAGPVPQGWGMFVTSRTAVEHTFGRAVLCVGRRVYFAACARAQDGRLSSPLDNSRRLERHGLLAPGETLHFQAWFRDRHGRGKKRGACFNTSDGLRITFEP